MRKLSELTGDEFFDAIYALSPILPIITDMQIVQMQLFNKCNQKIVDARTVIESETIKRNKAMETKDGDGTSPVKNKTIETCDKRIFEANSIIETEITAIFSNDISKIIPLLISRESRNCIFETISILENVSIEEVKKYHAPKLISKIKDVIKDADFKSFLSYAE